MIEKVVVAKSERIAAKLYLLNLVLLITHEIDSAFWCEWNLFGLPGEIDLFLILNFGLILVFMYGFEKVVRWDSGASLFSYLLAFVGMFAFCIHMIFIIAGNPEFASAVSMAILILTFVTSIAQIVVLQMIKSGKAT